MQPAEQRPTSEMLPNPPRRRPSSSAVFWARGSAFECAACLDAPVAKRYPLTGYAFPAPFVLDEPSPSLAPRSREGRTDSGCWMGLIGPVRELRGENRDSPRSGTIFFVV